MPRGATHWVFHGSSGGTCRRHGTLSLFAALDMATGKIIGTCFARHRARELKSLREIENNVPLDLDIHLVLDNSSTHKTPAVRRWLASKGSLPNSPKKQIRRRVHRSTHELERAIRGYNRIETVNGDLKQIPLHQVGRLDFRLDQALLRRDPQGCR